MNLTPAVVNDFVTETYAASAISGVRCTDLGDGWAEARWVYDETTLRPGGYISGPTIFALADSALWFAVFTRIGLAAMAVTSDLNIHFLRPAIGGDLMARAELTKTGRRLAHGMVRLWVEGDPDRLVAFASGAYALP